ncbi:MAG: electron transport complex subunit RsxB [Gammaproteobacteria bacterium]
MLNFILAGSVIAIVAGFVLRTNISQSDKKKEILADKICSDKSSSSLVDNIDQILPQTQCGECSYDGCRPYAEAISSGEANINLCPPGGGATIDRLAKLLGRDVIPLNPEHGHHRPFRIAVVIEDECIGCTKCIQACPVDAIFGAAKQMHTVIADHCTGCELCIPPCPVDCIEMKLPRNNTSDVSKPVPGDAHKLDHERAA